MRLGALVAIDDRPLTSRQKQTTRSSAERDKNGDSRVATDDAARLRHRVDVSCMVLCSICLRCKKKMRVFLQRLYGTLQDNI